MLLMLALEIKPFVKYLEFQLKPCPPIAKLFHTDMDHNLELSV